VENPTAPPPSEPGFRIRPQLFREEVGAVKTANKAEVKVWREIYQLVAAELGRKECETWLKPAVCTAV